MDAPTAYGKVLEEMKKKISGKTDTIELMFIALVSNGHALLEGVPGVAKTTITKALAECMQSQFSRIQGTPDLESKDIVGYTYVGEGNELKFSKGPVFTNVLLIDELNRAPPKMMSAFIEALGEYRVTIGTQDMLLPRPFNAFATQNPLKIEGTEALPKVIADRFLMKIDVGYPSMEEERNMLRIKETDEKTVINKILSTDDIIQMQAQAKEIIMPDEVVDYITKVVDATRRENHVVMGASPRADIAFMHCAKAKALIEGRKEISIDDIRYLAKPVLSHRIVVRSTGGVGISGVIEGIVVSLG